MHFDMRRLIFFAFIPIASCASARTSDSIWTYTMSRSPDSDSTRDHRQESVDRLWVGQDRVRMETVKVPAGQARESGVFTIVDAHDNTLKRAHSSDRTASVRAIPGIDGVDKSLAPKIGIAYTKHTIDDLGPGEPLLGHATRRYHISALGTLTLSLGGHSCARHIDVETEVWMASDVDLDAPRLQAMSVFGVVPFTLAPVPPGDALVASLKGLALRSISTSHSVDSSGTPSVVTTRTEVTKLSRLTGADSMLVVPSDYSLLDLRPTLSADAKTTLAADPTGGRLGMFCRSLGS